MKQGDKVAEYCITELCEHYQTIVALSNLADLKNNVICPKIFCERVKYKSHLPEEKKIEIVENKEIDEKVILENLKKIYSSTELKLEIYWDIDKVNKNISFFNPMNSTPTPLVWSFQYMRDTNFNLLKSELDHFFKTFLDKFKEEELKSCKTCPDEITTFNGMNCIDCTRNKNSQSIIKRDRFRGIENE
jgi:hypothetical protein